jgi:hypothetical protein
MPRFQAPKQGEIRALCAFLETCGDFATVSPHCSKLPFFAGQGRIARGKTASHGRRVRREVGN